MGRPPVGDQELSLLRFLAENGPLSVGEAFESFGAEHGWARSTVLTVMERLRAKGYLTRRRATGVFRYAAPDAPDALLRGVIGDFVQRALGGSISPVVNYLSTARDLSADEIDQLEQLVKRLARERRKVRP
jgi:predicted transcriptional regulator